MRALVLAGVVAACGARDAPPECAHLPPRDCALGPACGELIRFAPARGLGYFDDALAGEQTAATSTSYARRDLVMLVKYATAKVACTTGAGPLGLGDMSDRDGATPGTSRGAPRHPPDTHVDGLAIDLAYYQTGTPDNRVRAICPHVWDGVDQHHCIAPPTTLDVERTARLIGALSESRHVRVIGVDGRIGDTLVAAIHALCDDGELDADACRRLRLAYEPVDAGGGWFLSHHTHLHVAWRAD